MKSYPFGFSFPIQTTSAASAASALENGGAVVLVAAADGRPAREAFDRDHPLAALIVGNEGAGVRPELRAVAADIVAVPMAGAAESLNAGVAGSILMYEWTR